jgi:hypothetical protein
MDGVAALGIARAREAEHIPRVGVGSEWHKRTQTP